MPLKKGNTNIGAIYKGTTQIAKIYKGTTLLFENAVWLNYLFNYLYHSLIPTTIDNKAVQDKARLTKISGNGVVENQIDFNGDFHSNDSSYYSTTEPDYMSMSIANNVLTCSVIQAISSGTTGNLKIDTAYKGHKYLFSTLLKSTVGNNTVRIGFSINNAVEYGDFLVNQGETKLLSGIYETITSATTQTAIIRFQGGHSAGNTFESYYYEIIDLTLMFGTGNEPTTLTDNRIQALLNRGYIAYNTGEYKNSKVSEIETFDSSNQLLDTITLNGLLELNGAINSHDTFENTNTGYVFTRNVWKYTFTGNENFTRSNTAVSGVYRYWFYSLSNVKGYDNNQIGDVLCDNLTADTNNHIYSATNDYSIGIFDDGGFDLIVKSVTDVATMQSFMNGKTMYYPLATPQVITIPKKHLGCVDLGSLNWQKESYTYGGQDVYRFKAQVSGIKVTTSTSTIHNLYCKKYMTDTANHSFQQTSDKIIALDTNGYVVVNDGAYSTAADFKNAVQGQYLFYETENEVSDFDNIAQINAGGSITSNSEVLPNVSFKIKCK